jgi:hypothetical protein
VYENIVRDPIQIRFTESQEERWATGWTIGVLGFDSRRGLGIFLFTASRTALGPTQPPIQWVPESLPLGVKRPGREADYLPPSSGEVKNTWRYTSTPSTPSWRGAQLKAQGQLYVKFLDISHSLAYRVEFNY